jgi:hypothetical protein
MVHAVDLDHEPSRLSKEVDDEAVHDDLAPKLHAKLARAEREPEQPLGLGRSQAHTVRMSRKVQLPTKM